MNSKLLGGIEKKENFYENEVLNLKILSIKKSARLYGFRLADLRKYINQDWFKYIWIPEKNIQKDYKLNFSGLPYFKKISQPILVIQGLLDNVIPKNSYIIIEKAIKKSESNIYEIITLENTTHSMTYLDKEFPYFQMLTPKYLASITEWLSTIENK